MNPTCTECGSKIHFGENELCPFCLQKKDFLRFPLESHLNNANVPKRSSRNTLALYAAGSIMPETRFNEYFEKGLFITGNAGIGKTALAVAIIIYHMEQYFTVKNRASKNKTFWFENSTELLISIRQSYGKDSGGEERILEKLKSADLLVIDDFGAEKTTDWSLSILYSIINYRYEEYKQTIFTSNLTLKNIARNFGDERITRRIEDCCLTIEMK